MKKTTMMSALLLSCSALTYAQTATVGSGTSVTISRDENDRTMYRLFDTENKENRPKELKQHRFKKKQGKLSIELGTVSIEGYKGDEVIISMMVETKETDPRAVGLQGINSSGFQANTVMGLNIMNDGELTRIRHAQWSSSDTVRIRVPEQLHVSIKGTQVFWSSGNISVKDMRGELEVSSTQGAVRLDNITGPVTVKSMTGDIEAVFRAPVRGPVSLITSTGFVDVALPLNTNATLDMRAGIGELYAAPDFNIEVIQDVAKVDVRDDAVMEEDRAKLTMRGTATVSVGNGIFNKFGQLAFSGTGARVNGTINGGGEDIILRTSQGKVYLRTTK